MYKQLETGLKAKKNASFICFYDSMNDGATITILSRKDFSIGFPGGKVDEGESIYDAAKRECMEEIGFDVDKGGLVLLCTHEVTEGFNSHLFMCQVENSEMYRMQRLFSDSSHGKNEASGLLVCKLDEKSKKNILSTPCAETVREELMIVFDYVDNAI